MTQTNSSRNSHYMTDKKWQDYTSLVTDEMKKTKQAADYEYELIPILEPIDLSELSTG